MSRPHTLLPALVDHHVHLGLVDASALSGGALARVVDLGWTPAIATLTAPVEIDYAGCFLAAPGGYPGDRSWSPPGSVVEVQSADHAAEVVAGQRELGACVVKATMNADAGPVHAPDVLAALVAAAAPLPLVVHAEGEGMVRRALDAGAAALAHTPWTEVLDPDLAGACVDAGQRWISTLDMHGHGVHTASLERATDNLRGFLAAGGRVLYGTDLGNGPLPVGLNRRELALLREAGLDDDDLLAALTDRWPHAADPAESSLRTAVPDEPGEDLLDRLSHARVVDIADLEE